MRSATNSRPLHAGSGVQPCDRATLGKPPVVPNVDSVYYRAMSNSSSREAAGSLNAVRVRAVEVNSVEVNGVELAVEEFGPTEGPAIVLVPGASSSMDWWDRAFCVRLAAGDAATGPRRVIAYDLRDTGTSTTVPLGEARYTLSDLVDDLAELIVRLRAAPAHVVGLSLGGGLAQQLALSRPQLLASMTLLATSPSGGGSSGGLPPPIAKLTAYFERQPGAPDWHDPAAVAAYFIDSERAFSGDIAVDDDRIAAIATTMVRRSIDPTAGGNHFAIEEGEGLGDELESIRVPTLVMHGTADPLFPYPHAESLAARIPRARLVPIPGMGHQFPPPSTWDLVVAEILAHTR